jgi:CBS domain-containing protein
MGQVSDILATKGSAVLEIDAEATVFDAVSKMVDGNVGSLLVTEGGRLVGIVTERDYLRRVAVVGRDERTTPVREVMSAPIVYTTPESSIEECMAVMTERRIRHLPVLTESREVTGVVSIGDLVKYQTREQSAQIKFLEEYISG